MNNEMPQTAAEIADVMAEAKRIFADLKQKYSRGVLMCLASESRKWEWSESGLWNDDPSLRSCLTCGQMKSPTNEAV